MLDRDDYRTGTLDAGLLGRHLAIAGNASVLTSRQDRTRNDQATGSMGYVATTRDALSYLSLGAGVRGWGDFGGGHVQNQIHRVAGYQPLGFQYDRVHRIDPLLYASGRWTWESETSPAMSWVAPPGRWGVALSGGGLGTANGDWEGEAEFAVLYGGRQGSAWTGVRLHDEIGSIPGATAQAVARRERGLWLVAGSTIEPTPRMGVLATVGIDPGTHQSFGIIGLLVHPAPHERMRQGYAVEEDIGYFAGAVVGAQYRWTPLALTQSLPQGSGRLVLTEIALDYRFGGVRTLEFTDNEALSDQLTIGPAVTLQLPPILGLCSLRPYAELLDGVRTEHIAVQGPNPRFGDSEAASGVTQLGVGLRVALHLQPTSTVRSVLDHVRAGGGYDRWFPWHSAELRNGADHQEYLRTLGGWGGYLGCMLDW